MFDSGPPVKSRRQDQGWGSDFVQPGTHIVLVRLIFNPMAQFLRRKYSSLRHIMDYLRIVAMEVQTKGLMETRPVFLFGFRLPKTCLCKFIEKRGKFGFSEAKAC